MRHKLLDCIAVFIGTGDVDWVVEIDECFVPVSYKGNHTKSGFIMPRPARKRGKEVKKRGISNEQAYISGSIDRNGNIILQPICTGRITHNDLENLYYGHIDNKAIFVLIATNPTFNSLKA